MLKVPPRWEPVVRKVGEFGVYIAVGFVFTTGVLAGVAGLAAALWAAGVLP